MIYFKDYCDKELTYALMEVGYPIWPIPIGGQQPNKPVYYDLPIDHPDWRNCDAYHPHLMYEVQQWLIGKNLYVEVEPLFRSQWNVVIWNLEEMHDIYENAPHKSYHAAMRHGLKVAVQMLKKENNDKERTATAVKDAKLMLV